MNMRVSARWSFFDSSNLTICVGDNYNMFQDNFLHDICDIYDLKKIGTWFHMSEGWKSDFAVIVSDKQIL